MTHAPLFLLSLGGFALLLLAMTRHQQDWLRRKLSPLTARCLRLSGIGMLTLALIVAGITLGWGQGAVTWFGWLTIAAALAVTVNTNRERLGRLARRVRP